MSVQIVGIQFNARVGELLGNSTYMAGEILKYSGAVQPTIMLFPELALTGYFLQDQVRIPAFCEDARRMLEERIAPMFTGKLAGLVGFPHRVGSCVFNAVAFCAEGKVRHIFTKTELPNDSVFDEYRTYTEGSPAVVTWHGTTFGVPICEDVWRQRVAATMAKMGATILLSPNYSPYYKGKWATRKAVLQQRVTETGLPLFYLNGWGGQDELGFDGQSALVLPDGSIHRAAMYEDATIAFSFNGTTVSDISIDKPFVQMEEYEECEKHLVMVLRDYAGQLMNGKITLALSGGIDSAVALCLDVAAVGAHNVRTVGMPSGFSPEDSVNDAQDLAEGLGVVYDKKPIEDVVNAVRTLLATGDGAFTPEGITDENLQARVRGLIAMAYSNAGHGMVTTTGNKSEMSVGYATLYGDMNGGFNPIKDLDKMEVYELAKWFEAKFRKEGKLKAADALKRTIDKIPSAGLRPDQKDSDNLPEYPILVQILDAIIEQCKVPREIEVEGATPAEIEKVYYLVRTAEFKRRQSGPGTKWHRTDLDKDWRYPLSNAYKPLKANEELPQLILPKPAQNAA